MSKIRVATISRSVTRRFYNIIRNITKSQYQNGLKIKVYAAFIMVKMPDSCIWMVDYDTVTFEGLKNHFLNGCCGFKIFNPNPKIEIWFNAKVM